MSEDIPKGFDDLKPTELYRSALEDFALPVEEEDKNKKKVLLAAFVEGGVTWEDYVEQHPEYAEPVDEPTEAELRSRLREGQVITSNAPKHNTVEDYQPVEPENKWDTTDPRNVEAVAVVTPAPRIVVKESIPVTSQDSYLIKMDRKNPLFEVRGHRFTQSHPYALMNAEDADYVLTHEDGFRQATPSELREYYG